MNAANPPPHGAGDAIDLAPDDWFWATWRPRAVRVRPEARPFDQAACVARLAKVSARRGAEAWGWDELGLPDSLSPQEAHFWFVAMTRASQEGKPAELARWAARQNFSGRVTAVEVRAAFRGKAPLDARAFALVLGQLLPATDVIDLLREQLPLAAHRRQAVRHHLFGIHRHLLPYLSDEEVARVRESVRPEVGPALWEEAVEGGTPPVSFHLAAFVGLHEPLAATVESWPDGWLGRYRSPLLPELLVFGLGSARAVEQEARRLGMTLYRPEFVRAWLAHTECSALDLVREAVLAAKSREACEPLLEALACVRSPEAAAPMLEAKLGSASPALARAWMEANPAAAAAGLLPLLAGRGKMADAAAEALHELKRKGHGAEIDSALEALAARDPVATAGSRGVLGRGGAVVEPFDEADTPAWLAGNESRSRTVGKPRPLPAWLDPDLLPPILVGDRRLNAGQIAVVLLTLRDSTLDAPPPLLVALKQHASRESLEPFVWHLIETWLAEGGEKPHRWALHAAGLLGSDASALRLGPMARAWANERQGARAAVGLGCLRAIGTDTALMQLDALARSVRSPTVRGKAREAMAAAASARGLTPEELEDRAVPDCGLDPRGSRAFDLGGRKFFFALAGGMKPMLRDEEGKLRPGLPRPAAGDDRRLYESARADFDLLKRQVKQVTATQADRLRKAMTGGRRWTPDSFARLCRHPLMGRIVRLLVWGLHDPSADPDADPADNAAHLVAAFRVTGEGDWADADDKPVEPRSPGGEPEALRIGLLHPAYLSEAQRVRWGQVLGDYEIIPPFPQLTRSVHPPTPAELEGTDITRFAGNAIPVKYLVAVLQNMGWSRNPPIDGSRFDGFSRPFPQAGVTAVAQEEGNYDAGRLTRLFFIRRPAAPRTFDDYAASVKLRRVDPALVSEVIRDVQGVIAVAAKNAKR